MSQLPSRSKASRVIFSLSLLSLLLGQALSYSSVQASPNMQTTPPPDTVTIPGTIQSKLGCSGDWQPDCAKTFLTYNPTGDVWRGEFDLPVGTYEYKVALNKTWGENYGLKATRNGPNIPLNVTTAGPVRFYYDHKTHWVTDSVNSVIAMVVGNFQTRLGCAKDNDPTCLRSWLEDPEGTGIYSLTTRALPAGTYEVKVALNESMNENYAPDGTPNGPAVSFEVPKDGAEVYFGYDPATHRLLVSAEGAPKGTLSKFQAYWVTRDTILWNIIGSPKYSYFLHYDPTGAMKLDIGKMSGGTTLTLHYAKGGPDPAVFQKFPQLLGFTALKLDPADVAKVPEILKGQFAVTARDDQDKLIDATSLQIPGVLDDLYTYKGPLGIDFSSGAPTLRLWAPTARSVTLLLFPDSDPNSPSTSLPMILDPQTGVWAASGSPDWLGKFYLYQVEVYVPREGKILQNLVTDPYSLSLSTNSTRSQIVNLEEADLKPQGWDALAKPTLNAPEDSVIYELHIRDFSVNDQAVPAELRGTYKAFTVSDSNGMKHLRSLASAGLTHVHILPAFDIATINEDKSTWQSPDPALLATFPTDSDQQQALVAKTIDQDAFNWGYDPYHYTTPEGSYATQPDGSPRILEFREMVKALSDSGLRVVMDVVYNHTNASGQDPRSVLDKIVPMYYHRLNANGVVENSTCCQNTATEHNMMEKLMIDSVLTWAKEYKVDGFRFDLMGHHMLDNMVHVRQALDSLTLAKDGVDGKSIYIYGEGWDFGEVANNARGKNATQLNIAGTGIGVFNDRLRDAARGGSPFSALTEQGFLTGLFDDPNTAETRSPQDQKGKLLQYEDWIRIGLAGNLSAYSLVQGDGKTVTGKDIDYNGKPAGYTQDPQENINYISAHDNQTIFDAIQMKAPAAATLADRVRMSNLGLSLVMLGQGVPFFHAGDDLLRSKSLDGNSYNSGDWFNRLDFTYQSDNFAVGLPMAGDNQSNWNLMKPLLADPSIKPGPAEILNSVENFKEMLQIRKSSSLFRLQTGQEIQDRLKFYNTGPGQLPGLIVMHLDGSGFIGKDNPFTSIVVLFNANREPQTFNSSDFQGASYTLHPVQLATKDPITSQAAFDPASGSFKVPGRTAAVFVILAPPAPEPTATQTAQPAVSQAAQATSTPIAAFIPIVAGEAAQASTGLSQPWLPWLFLAIVALLALALFLWRRSITK